MMDFNPALATLIMPDGSEELSRRGGDQGVRLPAPGRYDGPFVEKQIEIERWVRLVTRRVLYVGNSYVVE